MFRFTIRDLLWLMVVVGLASGWWNAERNALQRHNQSLRALESENNDLLHAQGALQNERDRAIKEAKEYREIINIRQGLFGRPDK
jgi:lipopolysaccharide biosynthesis regulator YciM